MKARSDHDVIISGAGPVGLMLAGELALRQCSVLILERAENPHTPLKRLPFGIRGLSAPSIEALDRRGLLSQLEVHQRVKSPHANAGQGARRQAGHFAGIPFHDGDIDSSAWPYRLPSSTPPSLISEMAELESLLARRATALGAEIRRGLSVTDFRQNEDEVSVRADAETFAARWLVGCDGSRSAVRKAGGFEFAGTEPEFTGYTAQVDIVDPEQLKTGRNVTKAGMYLQSQPGYLVLQDFDGGAFHAADRPVTLEHVQEVLRRISNTDVTLGALHLAATWTDRARQVTSYRNGRVLLAGDAAHIHSPLGGQGLNLGLGDAMNLGWKLAATIQKQAPEGLLDSYQTERHPIGAQVLDWSRAQVAIMKPGPTARALNAIVRDLMNTRDGASYFAGRVWGVSLRYELDSAHPLVGRSAPNFELGGGVSLAELLRKGQGMLLDFSPDSALEGALSGYDASVEYCSASASERLGLSAILIRPDGVVAWAADHDPNREQLLQAAARWFVLGAKGQ